MKIKAIAAALLLSLSAAASEPVEVDPAGGFAARLREKCAQIESIECRFVQTRRTAMLRDEVRSEGDFYYRRENGGIALVFDDPTGDMIVLGQTKFKVVADGRKSVVGVNSNPMLRQMRGMFEACMSGDVAALAAGGEARYFDCGDSYRVEIVPAGRARNMINRIVLGFDKRTMTLSTLAMEEASGDSLSYVFSDKRFDTEVDPSHFAM